MKYKTKSTRPGVSNEEVENTSFLTSFMSFERAIAENPFLKSKWDNREVVGYTVTDIGIEIHFDTI